MIPAERIEQLRRELPKPIEQGGQGRKVHGRVINPDGTVEPIVNGRDDDWRLADERLNNSECPSVQRRLPTWK